MSQPGIRTSARFLDDELKKGLAKTEWEAKFACLPTVIGRTKNSNGKWKRVWVFWEPYQTRKFTVGAATLSEFRLDPNSPVYVWKPFAPL
jgi:hypothetical protein